MTGHCLLAMCAKILYDRKKKYGGKEKSCPRGEI